MGSAPPALACASEYDALPPDAALIAETDDAHHETRTESGVFTRGKRGRLVTLFLSSSLTVLAAAIIAPSLHAMKLQFADVPNVELYVQLILTTPALFIVFGSPVAGWLADRIGRKPVLLVGLLFYAVAGSSGLYLDTIPAILVGRAALGLAVAAVMTAATTLLADYYDDQQRIRVLGIQAAFMGLGGVVFLLLGGAVAAVHWRLPFATYLLSLLIFVPALRYIHEPAMNGKEGGGKGTEPARQTGRMPWRTVVSTVAMVYLIEVCFYLIPIHSPFRYANLGFPEPWRVAASVATLSGCFAIVAALASRLRALLGLRWCFALGFGAASIGLAGIGLIETFVYLFVPFAVMGAGFGLIIPNLTAWLAAETTQQIRGRAMGIYSAALFFGQFMAPVISQPIANRSSIAMVYYVAAFSCLAFAPLAYWIAPHQPGTASDEV